MCKLFPIFFVAWLVSCSNSTVRTTSEKTDSNNVNILNNKTTDTSRERLFSRAISSKRVNDSIIWINISSDIQIHWNNKTSGIEEDLLFEKVKSDFQKQKMFLADEIGNTFETPAVVCPKGLFLTAGDIAYLIIDKIEYIPVLKIMNMQFDQIQIGCPYPIGLISLLKDHREYVAKSVKNYLLSTKSS